VWPCGHGADEFGAKGAFDCTMFFTAVTANKCLPCCQTTLEAAPCRVAHPPDERVPTNSFPRAKCPRPAPLGQHCGPRATGRTKLRSLGIRPTILLAIGFSVVLQSAGRAQAPSDSRFDGVWLTDGYGEVLELKQNALKIYEITGVSCVAAGSARRRADSKPGEALFNGSMGSLRITSGNAADSLWLYDEGVSGIALHRNQALPEACGHKAPNTPQSNYEVFWRTFSEQYPFFALRKVDWSAVDEKFRPQVTSSTSPTELFKILRGMIEPLADAHTGIDANGVPGGRFDGYRSNTEPEQGNRGGRAREIIQQRYARGKLRDYCHEFELGSKPRTNLHFGLVGDSIGYLRIDWFPRHCGSALDQIFGEAAELKGLIIDERLNTGGYDAFGIALASRLTNHEYLAYSKVARNDVKDAGHRTAPQPVMVRASSRPGFTGQVILLIGPDSVSEAEVFAMSLFGRQPRVTMVGDNTQGVFSDVMERTLPNGWHFRLPNEIYFAEDGRSFDAVGVPPDVRVPVFSEQDLRNGRDSALEKAIELLGRAKR